VASGASGIAFRTSFGGLSASLRQAQGRLADDG